MHSSPPIRPNGGDRQWRWNAVGVAEGPTFVILSDTALAFGNIRSPGTLANIRRQPNVEVCFIDVVLRKAVRATGTASIHRKDGADAELREAFEERWAAFHPYMSSFVKIDVRRAELVLSPAYDVGFTKRSCAKPTWRS